MDLNLNLAASPYLTWHGFRDESITPEPTKLLFGLMLEVAMACRVEVGM